jgi:hypothetical protein
MKKVRRFVFMKNPFEYKPEKFNEHQGLVILAFEDVNKEERVAKSHAGKDCWHQLDLRFLWLNELIVNRYRSV